MNDLYTKDSLGNEFGPVDSQLLESLVNSYTLRPHDLVRLEGLDNWVKISVAVRQLNIDIPTMEEWSIAKKKKSKEDSKNVLLGCGVFILLAWGGSFLIGLNFILTPIFQVVVLWVVLCKILGVISSKNILSAPLWSDVRKKPTTDQLLQFVALSISMAVVVGFKVYSVIE